MRESFVDHTVKDLATIFQQEWMSLEIPIDSLVFLYLRMACFRVCITMLPHKNA